MLRANSHSELDSLETRSSSDNAVDSRAGSSATTSANDKGAPINSDQPGSSGAAGDVSSNKLPCCRIAPRWRRCALPIILFGGRCEFVASSSRLPQLGERSKSPQARRSKHKNGSSLLAKVDSQRFRTIRHLDDGKLASR